MLKDKIKYVLDKGNRCVVLSEKKIMRYYSRQINKAEYPTFETWIREMFMLGILSTI